MLNRDETKTKYYKSHGSVMRGKTEPIVAQEGVLYMEGRKRVKGVMALGEPEHNTIIERPSPLYHVLLYQKLFGLTRSLCSDAYAQVYFPFMSFAQLRLSFVPN